MILKRVPTPILVALGLGCGPTAGNDSSASQSISGSDGSEDIGDDDITGCLSKPTSDIDDGEDGEVGPCLSECLDVTGCLEPPLDTSTSSGGFISGTTGPCLTPPLDTGTTDGTDTGTDTGTGTDSGSGTDSGGTSGGTQDEGPRARSWREALERMEAEGTLPGDVLARLRAGKKGGHR
jgi:hypothetical protein